MEPRFVGRELVARCYPHRPKTAKKRDFGYVAVVGGSKLYPGAPVLAGLSAMKAGADLSMLIVPSPSFASAVVHPDLVATEVKGEYLSKLTSEAEYLLSKSNSLVIGNGLSQEPSAKKTVKRILEKYEKPVVIDGDALRMLKGIRVKSGAVIITPHVGEFREMTGAVPKNLEARKSECLLLSEKTGFTVLLKGPVDVIAGGGKLALNRTGNAYMTKGGTGDVLAGICGALLARGQNPFDSACAGAFLSGRAGEIASRKNGEGTLATDIFQCIPCAIKSAVKFLGFI
jgi:hydroxyethylthiazole kinase-like uncharacterized protein yjeF